MKVQCLGGHVSCNDVPNIKPMIPSKRRIALNIGTDDEVIVARDETRVGAKNDVSVATGEHIASRIKSNKDIVATRASFTSISAHTDVLKATFDELACRIPNQCIFA